MQTVEAGGLAIGDEFPPRIMGVLNVSERSPYDPSVYDDPEEAAEYVRNELIAEGADIVDIGLESANKRFEVLSAAEERDRLDTAVAVVDRIDADVVFSIETRYHQVADEALSRGFDMVNDICGFADPELPEVCEAHDAAVVKMASPPDLERPGAVDSVDEIYDALRRGGFTAKTIVDPAFGGWSETKTLADDRDTFRRLGEFRAFDRPILVSINRKNFLRKLVDRETAEALPVSLGATAMAVERGAHVIRTHDVAETRDAAIVGHAFTPDRVQTELVEELDIRTTQEAQRHLQRRGDTAQWAAGPGVDAAEPSSQCIGRCLSLRVRGEHADTVLEVVEETPGVIGMSDTQEVFLGGSASGVVSMGKKLADCGGKLGVIGDTIIGDGHRQDLCRKG